MASRRILSDQNNIPEKDEHHERTPSVSGKSDIAPAVPAMVIIKLLGFTAAMAGGPIGVYFLTLNAIFRGNSTWAGATAALTANLVLIAYLIIAMREDESEKLATKEQTRKMR